MNSLHNSVDPDGLLEYSVVYTDRALNHMSHNFQTVMNDISSTLKDVYKASAVVIVPGSGTSGMEAVARQFAQNVECLVVRNGWFSYRWSQILEMGQLASGISVHTASPVEEGVAKPFAPANIDDVVAAIRQDKPALVFAPHVETSSGMVLSDEYIRAMSDAVHEVNGLMVLDCIASGCHWVDMEATGVDVLISAPQKGWSGPPCCGLVMLSDLAKERVAQTQSNSFALDLAKWLSIMEAYESGAHAYHATMPTESLRGFRDAMKETEELGFDEAKRAQIELGQRVREVLEVSLSCVAKGSTTSLSGWGFLVWINSRMLIALFIHSRLRYKNYLLKTQCFCDLWGRCRL